jgi:serine/threonine protein phosphatase PrpC
MAPDVVVDLLTTTTKVGDVYLLCSDGLNGMVSDEQILETLLAGKSLEEMCQALVSRANAGGGVDNTTVILAKVEEEEPATTEATEMDGIGLEETVHDDGPIQPISDPPDSGG